MFSFLKKPNKDLSKCRFDDDAYWEDIKNEISYKERMDKIKNLDYWIEDYEDGSSDYQLITEYMNWLESFEPCGKLFDIYGAIKSIEQL